MKQDDFDRLSALRRELTRLDRRRESIVFQSLDLMENCNHMIEDKSAYIEKEKDGKIIKMCKVCFHIESVNKDKGGADV